MSDMLYTRPVSLQPVRVKICGITRPEDALAAEAAGADAVGLIFAPRSKRRVTLQQAQLICSALGPFIAKVGVFVDAPLDEVLLTARQLRLNAVQLHGDETSDYAQALRCEVQVIRAFSFTPELDVGALLAFPADATLLDGLVPGSGAAFSWADAAALKGYSRLVLAGGLTPGNVGAGIGALEPYAVDVASGVESITGVKDPTKIQDFVHHAKNAPNLRLSTDHLRVVDNSVSLHTTQKT